MSGRTPPPTPTRRARVGVVVGLPLVAVLVGMVVATPAAAATSDPGASYAPPVAAEVVDRFRPPASLYGAGNRGVDYATVPGAVVAAAAPGTVAFAGAVGGSLHVSVLHHDGIRTTYSFLQAVEVRRGAHVEAGQVLGRATARLHWGARAGDAYVDPLLLLDAGGAGGRARLVPESGERRPRSEPEERRLLVDLLRTVGRGVRAVSSVPPVVARWAAAGVVDAARDQVVLLADGERGVAAWLRVLGPLAPTEWAAVAAAVVAGDRQGPCTPPEVAPPRHLPEQRRLAVLVAGFGSSSPAAPAAGGEAGTGSAAVFGIDTERLGYGAGDVSRFSYRGGTIEQRPYGPIDTHGDIVGPGTRLRALLDDLRTQHPGIPIDLIAHSQGGLVARVALADGDGHGVSTLVTLGTPHQGADLAAAGRAAVTDAERRYLGEAVHRGGALPVRPSAPALAGLAPGSALLGYLEGHPPPPSVRAVSVAARFDPVVPPARTAWAPARSVTVTVPGAGILQHGRLPASPGAGREIALAVAGLPPTCRGGGEAAVDAMGSVVLGRLERHLLPAVRGLTTRLQGPTKSMRP